MHLLFDLDGTLTDSREGIIRCYQHALAELGHDVPAAETLTAHVGPPLAACFAKLLRTDDPDTIELAVASYRRRFEERGMFENALYPGIAEALTQFIDDGHQLFVVTAKPSVYAARILQHFQIETLFEGVYGPALGQRHFAKASIIAAAIQGTDAPEWASVIGDRADDIAAAKANRLPSIGVCWGYGGRHELEQAGADLIVDSIADLARCVRRLGDGSAR